MRKIFISMVFLVIAIKSSGQSIQEKIINTPNSDQTFGAIEIQSDLYLALSQTNVFFGTTVKSIVYRANKDLDLIDSLDLTYHNGSDYFNVHNVLNASDSSFWVLGNAYYTQSGTSSIHAILINRNLDVMRDLKHFSAPSEGMDILNLCVIDSFVVASGNAQYPVIPAYLVWDQDDSVVYSKVIDTSGTGFMTALHNFNGRLLFGLSHGTFYSRGEININDFTIDTIIKDDSLTISKGFLHISDYVNTGSTQKDTIYCYGSQPYRGFAWYRLDSTLSLIELDTFATTPGKNTIVDRGMLDVSAEDRIYFVTTEDMTLSPSDLKPGLINQMRLWRIKKNGDVVWSVIVNDSSYYLPTKTVATSDGGAVFFSMKYDWRIDPSPKTSLSIIKLDSLGNFVALSETEVPYQNQLGVEIFPNPFNDYITLNNLDVREVESISIFNLKGEIIKQLEKLANPEIETEFLEQGTYLLRIIMKNGQSGVCKVIKE